jgi:type I restriction enzyme R subunit
VNTTFTESTVEQAALAWLSELGWQVKHGADISPAGDTLTLPLSQWERESYSEVVLEQRLRDALLPKLIRGEIRVKDAERFLMERGL